jgi:AcrR family transcriptional regulator
VDEIATAAGVTKGAVYHHFDGKEALFRAVHAEVEGDAMPGAKTWVPVDAPAILADAIREWVTQGAQAEMPKVWDASRMRSTT